MRPILFLFILVLCYQSSLAADIQPQKCNPDGANIKCVTNAFNLESGGGKQFSSWYSLVSTAPKGYKLKYAEGHIGGLPASNDPPREDGAAHKCGVTSDKSPISTDGPTKGYRSGTAYWAQCYIAEQDANHVVVNVNLQGLEKGGGFLGLGKSAWYVYANAELIAIYEPVESK